MRLLCCSVAEFQKVIEMAKYEWYVVTTKNPSKEKLSEIQKQLCKKYGGLTIIQNCKGLWLNHVGNIETDKVEIWRVLTNCIVLPSEAIKIGEQLKAITAQDSQLFTCNDVPYFS